MRTLARLFVVFFDYFGAGSAGRILEIDNSYATPRTKDPEHRSIVMVVKVEVDSRPYAFELHLSTLRAAVAADVTRSSLYRPHLEITPAEEQAVWRSFTEAAALDERDSHDG
jgi:hypothetical protein